VQEAARFYAKLRKMGFQIEFLDVGGGLEGLRWQPFGL